MNNSKDNVIFQSQNGLILVNTSSLLSSPNTTISIPKWSDFSIRANLFLEGHNHISIPKWSDFSMIGGIALPYANSISIPKWSDFSLTWTDKAIRIYSISIPKWSDFSFARDINTHINIINFNPKMV